MTQQIVPWYKQFWPWLVFGIPALTVVAGLSTVYIAFSDPDGLVSDDYYKDGLAINTNLAKNQFAKQLGIKADCQLADDKQLTITLSSREPLPAIDHLELSIVHTTRAHFDQLLVLTKIDSDHYAAKLPELTQGSWVFRIETAHWRIQSRQAIPLPKNFTIERF